MGMRISGSAMVMRMIVMDMVGAIIIPLSCFGREAARIACVTPLDSDGGMLDVETIPQLLLYRENHGARICAPGGFYGHGGQCPS